MPLFKVLTREGKGTHQNFAYPLPTAKRPGKWTDPVTPKICVSGYHIVHRVTPWLPSELFDIYIAEGRGKLDAEHQKVAYESIRLLTKVTPEWELLPLYPEVRAALMTTWKRENPEATKWPSWAYLSGAYLSGADLSRANLSRANLSWADLSGANLSGADLSRAYVGTSTSVALPSQYRVDKWGYVEFVPEEAAK